MAHILRTAIKGDVECNVPMGKYTTFGIGGEADILVYPLDREELVRVVSAAKKKAVPCSVVGAGSNLLVSDDGIRGVVVNLNRGFKAIKTVENDMLYCEAGAKLSFAVSEAARVGLAGLEFLAGIPGTVGGAVRMNAGAFGLEIKDVIDQVSFLSSSGETVVKNRDELDFSYRNLEMDEGDTIVDCTFRLIPDDSRKIKETLKKQLKERRDKQPLDMATAGSVFKNPPGDFAGRLIEEAGLKGLQAGRARVSEKHANFIENMGGASAKDVMTLIDIVKRKVFEKSGITLEREIKVLGEIKKRRSC